MKFRVLVVDDHAPFRTVAATVIETTDLFEICGEATTGEEAIQLAAGLRPDLVLMDVNLPGIDGVAATRAIKSRTPSVVVVLVSTEDSAHCSPGAAESGATAYLPKAEFSAETLTDAWTAACTTG